MLEKVKLALRIKSTALDADIKGAIEACKRDLKIAGVCSDELQANADVSDPLLLRTIILYCRADMNFDNDAERYQRAYEFQKSALALSGDYNDASLFG